MMAALLSFNCNTAFFSRDLMSEFRNLYKRATSLTIQDQYDCFGLSKLRYRIISIIWVENQVKSSLRKYE